MKAYFIGDCGHEICKKCREITPKCIIYSKKYQLFCNNCGGKAIDFFYLNCQHQGCIDCKINEYCYTYIKDKRYEINKEFVDNCSFFNRPAKNFFLRCYHPICLKCFDYLGKKLKDLNFSCIKYIKSRSLFDQTCTNCHKKICWIYINDEERIIKKECCKKIICLKCCKSIKKFKHRCKPA